MASLGRTLAPPRFVAFGITLVIGVIVGVRLLGWLSGIMAGFDAAALLFLLSCVPLLRVEDPGKIRKAATDNDANRGVVLALTVIVSIAVLSVIGAELGHTGRPSTIDVLFIVGTLALTWLFANVIYAFHYTHLYYTAGPDGGDCRGLAVPETDTPDYRDFLYFSLTMGMTFQTSDVEITGRRMRAVVTWHALVAFVFNLGVISFSVNVLGSG